MSRRHSRKPCLTQLTTQQHNAERNKKQKQPNDENNNKKKKQARKNNDNNNNNNHNFEIKQRPLQCLLILNKHASKTNNQQDDQTI